jgi:hypothetical protein
MMRLITFLAATLLADSAGAASHRPSALDGSPPAKLLVMLAPA